MLYQFAWQSTFHETWAVGYCRRKRQEGKSDSMVVRALANIWVRIMEAMWLRQHPYVAAIFLVAQHNHADHAA